MRHRLEYWIVRALIVAVRLMPRFVVRACGTVLGLTFYTVDGAAQLVEPVEHFSRGHAVVGVCGTPFKCPPAPSEAVLLLHDHLMQRGARSDCEISLVFPMGAPIPPSPDTSRALVAAFAERGIKFLPNHIVASVHWPGMPNSLALDQLQILAEEVMPQVRRGL